MAPSFLPQTSMLLLTLFELYLNEIINVIFVQVFLPLFGGYISLVPFPAMFPS